MNPTRTESIKTFLTNSTWPDLAAMYNHDMEVQVNVAADGGTRIEGEYAGRQWLAWGDGINTWKSFRIPYKAKTEPEYQDRPMSYDLARHAEGIGMTGWDWGKRVSRWFAYDFDALIGHSDRHSKKLTETELGNIRDIVQKVPWVTLRTSTSGKGLHLYVFLKTPHETRNHDEHAALARSILSMLTATTTYDFNTKVDICGSNMWVWHRKMFDLETKERIGLKVIKTGEPLDHLPVNWRDHLNVIRGKSKKTRPSFVDGSVIGSGDVAEDTFNELTGQRNKTPLDKEHKALLDYLRDSGSMWWWDNDHWMLVCHTHNLKQAHNILNLRGVFETLATGTEVGHDHNCFAYPLPRGAWAVRRYSQGVKEADTWDQDGNSWTKCYLNREIDFDTACKLKKGCEHPKGGYQFPLVGDMMSALKTLGVELECNDAYGDRTGLLKLHKEDGKIIVSIPATKEDKGVGMEGWIKAPKEWQRVVHYKVPPKLEAESNISTDDLVRHVLTPDNADCGWMLKTDGTWNDEPLVHVRAALDSMAYTPTEQKDIIGENVIKPWKLVNRPFEPEYPGDRVWNRNAAQLKYVPAPEPESHKHWDMILEHCGKSLDDAIRVHPWCIANGIMKGSEYLKCWMTSLIKEPHQPLPYLFFWSKEQDTGKSMFHEAFELLLTRGYMRADTALTSQGGFNGEFENVVLCVVEETDLSQSRVAYARIKDWVTSLNISIHRKQVTPYMIPNTTHWVQTANGPQFCPILPGDTRIVMIHVPILDEKIKIPKKDFVKLLEKEASDFLGSLMKLELPASGDRLNLPVITTEDKREVQAVNESELDMFIEKYCYDILGTRIAFSEFYDKFTETLPPNEVQKWSSKRVSMELPRRIVKGKCTDNPNIFLGNLTFDPNEAESAPYVKYDLVIRKGTV